MAPPMSGSAEHTPLTAELGVLGAGGLHPWGAVALLAARRTRGWCVGKGVCEGCFRQKICNSSV